MDGQSRISRVFLRGEHHLPLPGHPGSLFGRILPAGIRGALDRTLLPLLTPPVRVLASRPGKYEHPPPAGVLPRGLHLDMIGIAVRSGPLESRIEEIARMTF